MATAGHPNESLAAGAVASGSLPTASPVRPRPTPAPVHLVVTESGALAPVWSAAPSEPEPSEVAEYCKTAMQHGSLSFFLASRLLNPKLRLAVHILYSWCRFCDDVTDQSEDVASVAIRSLALDELRRRTWAAMHPAQVFLPPSWTPVPGEDLAERRSAHVFAAFGYLVRAFAIPDYYPQELLSGMEMDLAHTRYADFASLRLYAYRVAGTVGLMFSHLAGVSDQKALAHAADLGMAMQLTNIARDVQADFALGRVYLPTAWLAEVGLTPAQVGDPACREAVATVVRRLLAQAEQLYLSGEEGLVYLPLGAAFAAAAARLIYAEIGRLIVARGPKAWDQRAVVSLPKKLRLVGRAALLVFHSWSQRQRPWRGVAIRDLWRFA